MPDELSAHTLETAIPAQAVRPLGSPPPQPLAPGPSGEHPPPAASVALPPLPSHLSQEEYLRQRQLLVDAGQRGRQRLDQLLIVGATGALVLSVTFLEKIAPSPATDSRRFLVAGWVALLLALGLSMLGYEASSHAFEHGVRGLDRQWETRKAYDPTTNRWDHRTVWLNRLSLLTFFFGIVALVIFAYENVPFRQ